MYYTVCFAFVKSKYQKKRFLFCTAGFQKNHKQCMNAKRKNSVSGNGCVFQAVVFFAAISARRLAISRFNAKKRIEPLTEISPTHDTG